MKKVSIIIPACNEEAVIGDLVRSIAAELPQGRHLLYEVLVVDDGSTDRTAEVAAAAGARVVRHPYNIGNGAAVKTGMRNARGEVFVMMDGDGQHKPADILRLVEPLDRFDMVVGARTRGSQASVHRDLANRVYNLFASYVTGRRIEDLTSGFRAIRGDVARKFVYLLPNTFSYPTTITLGVLRAGHSLLYVPIQARPRVGKSKIKLLKDGSRFFLIITRIATFFAPLKIFIPLSLGIFLMGAAYYAYTYFTRHQLSNMVMLLWVLSALMFCLGLISEQITQLRFDRTEG